MTISVNRRGHVELKGNLEKKITLMKLEEIVWQKKAMAKDFCNEKNGSKFVCDEK